MTYKTQRQTDGKWSIVDEDGFAYDKDIETHQQAIDSANEANLEENLASDVRTCMVQMVDAFCIKYPLLPRAMVKKTIRHVANEL